MFNTKHYISSISADDYITGFRNTDKFIEFCKQCNKYGHCWACPPFMFSTDDYIHGYEYVYIIGTKIAFTESARMQNTSLEKNKEIVLHAIAETRRKLDQQLLALEKIVAGSKAFFAGTCHLCDEDDCTRDHHEPCRYPEKIRPSLEAFGFDIGKTSEKLLNIELKWSHDERLPEYLTLVSGLFTNIAITDVEKHLAGK